MSIDMFIAGWCIAALILAILVVIQTRLISSSESSKDGKVILKKGLTIRELYKAAKKSNCLDYEIYTTNAYRTDELGNEEPVYKPANPSYIWSDDEEQKVYI